MSNFTLKQLPMRRSTHYYCPECGFNLSDYGQKKCDRCDFKFGPDTDFRHPYIISLKNKGKENTTKTATVSEKRGPDDDAGVPKENCDAKEDTEKDTKSTKTTTVSDKRGPDDVADVAKEDTKRTKLIA